jgi:hypothetical protein
VLLDDKKLVVTHQTPFSMLLKTQGRPSLLRIVDDVRTVFQNYQGYVYIPEVSSQSQI